MPMVTKIDRNKTELKSFYQNWRDASKSKDFPDTFYMRIVGAAEMASG
jgi:hypothetical protein